MVSGNTYRAHEEGSEEGGRFEALVTKNIVFIQYYWIVRRETEEAPL